jgi:E3 SUMO-protein ligase NSE2
MLLTEDGDESDSDDELEVGGVTQDFKCPITLTILQNPLTSYVHLLFPDRSDSLYSHVCGHSFSSEAIRGLFRGVGRGQKPCPTTGCNKRFALSDCYPDKELEKQIKFWERRQKRREEEIDDAEVIE